MARKPQIACYLERGVSEDLTAYAKSLALSRPNLLALLILRTVRTGRLGSLVGRYATSVPKRGAKRVTARFDGVRTKRDFTAAAEALSLGSDDAAAFVFRAELVERWLEHALAS